MTAERSEAVTSRKGAHHQSSLETILDGCSWQFFLANELSIPTPPKPHSLVGTSFHAAIEMHENKRMSGEKLPTLNQMVDYAEDLIAKEADLIPKVMMVGRDREEWDTDTLVDMCMHALTNWYKAKTKEGGTSHREFLLGLTPVAIEPYFKLNLVENHLPIGGWIDGVYRKPDGKLILVDQKTAGDFSRWPLNGDGHRYQATLYSVALLLSEDYPEVTDLEDMEMHYLVSRTRGGQSERVRHVVVKPNLDDVAILGERIRQAEHIMNNKLYTQNTGWAICSRRFCPFYEGCQVTKELSKSPDELLEEYKQ
jgi:hypothetical protein